MSQRERWPELSKEQERQIIERYEGGMSAREVEEETGVSRYQVLYLMHEVGLRRSIREAFKARWRGIIARAGSSPR